MPIRFALLALLLAGCTLAPPPPEVPRDPNLGIGVDSPESPLRVTVFTDFGCARCGEIFHILSGLAPAYEGRLMVSYRDYITPAINPGAYKAALAARCAAEQGKYERYATLAYAYEGDWAALADEQLRAWAGTAELDLARLEACLQDQRPAELIAIDVADAKLLRVTKTPVIFFGASPTEDPGTSEAWKELLDRSVHALIRRAPADAPSSVSSSSAPSGT